MVLVLTVFIQTDHGVHITTQRGYLIAIQELGHNEESLSISIYVGETILGDSR